MKKLMLLLVPLLLLVAASGAIYWKYGRQHDSITLAQQMIDKGDLKGAQLELRNAVRGNPQNTTAHFRLGQVDLRLGDPVAAEKELKTARDMGFDARTLSPLLAQSYMAQGHYRELLRDFPSQGLPPDQAGPLLVLRSLAQVSVGDPDAAYASATEAERLTPQSAEPEIALARITAARQDFATSEQKIDRALQLNPRSVDALMLRGQLLNLKGDRTRALEAFDTALSLAPNTLAIRLERANVLLLGNQDVRAKEDIAVALKLEPQSAMGLFLQGVVLAKEKDYAGSDAVLNKIASLIPRFPRGYYFVAVNKFNLGQAEQASDAAGKFLAKNPNDPDAIKLFARIEMAGGRAPRAIDVLSKAVGGGIADPDMLDLLGRAYAVTGKLPQAVQSLERAAVLAPNNPDILARLASLRLGLGDAARATSDLEHALQLSPDLAGAGENLVIAAISAGEIDKATIALDRLRRNQGDTEVIGNLMALIRMAQLDLDGARAQLGETIAKFPGAVQPRINLAKVLILQDKPEEAKTVLTELLNRDPTSATALNTMVTLLLADRQTEPAIALLERAHKAAPKNADVSIGLVNLYGRAGKADKGQALLDESLKIDPDSMPLLLAQARLQISLGRSDAARATYLHVLDIAPTDVPTRRALADLQLTAKDADGAKATIAAGLKLLPGDESLLQAYVAVILRSSGLDAALTAADTLSHDPNNQPAAAALKGDVYMSAARFNDAANAYQVELRGSPSTPLLLRAVGALSAGGRNDAAAQLLRDWLQRQPDDPQAAEALSALDISARRFFDAEAHLQIVLAARPGDASALNNMAWVYQQRADSRALPMAQKAYLIAPSPQAADTLGWIMTSQGKAAGALALLRQAAGQMIGDPTVNYHLALALNQTGHPQDAMGILRGILGGLLDFDERPAAQRLYDQLSKAQ